MKKEQRAALKKRIQQEIAELRANAADLKDTTAPVEPDDAIGRLSRLDSMLNKGINDASLAQTRQRILRLETALIRVDEDPEFGECQDCGEEIPIARLLALPESVLCVDCAE